MSYIGRQPTVGNFQICDAISVVNGQAAYTMQVGSVNVTPQSANHMIVSLNGTIQKPNSSFTVSGSTITFSSNLATGDVIDFIQILGDVLDLGVPSDATVTTAKIVDANVTSAKVADDAITLAKMASGTDGNIISYDASGNPVAVATGNDGQVLTSTGAGSPPAFETLTTGKILQVVQKIDTTNRTTTSSTYTSGIGGALQIQPSATSSKILIMASVLVYRTSSTGYLTLAYQGSSLATNSADAFAITDGDGHFYATSGMHFLHSPNTTDIKSYDVLMKTNNNGSPNVECANNYAQAVLTLMEIAG